jgi:hypothetical protein
MWLVLRLKTEAKVSLCGEEIQVKIAGMADGCTGCLLVFETREQAFKYGGHNIIEVEFDRNTEG